MLDAVEGASARFRRPPSPLLEEEGDVLAPAEIPDVDDPATIHRPGPSVRSRRRR